MSDTDNYRTRTADRDGNSLHAPIYVSNTCAAVNQNRRGLSVGSGLHIGTDGAGMTRISIAGDDVHSGGLFDHAAVDRLIEVLQTVQKRAHFETLLKYQRQSAAARLRRAQAREERARLRREQPTDGEAA